MTDPTISPMPLSVPSIPVMLARLPFGTISICHADIAGELKFPTPHVMAKSKINTKRDGEKAKRNITGELTK